MTKHPTPVELFAVAPPLRPARRLSADQIRALVDAVVACNLTRETLTLGLPQDLLAGIRRAGATSKDGWLEDLHALNDFEPDDGVEPPLVAWLKAAAHTARPRKEERVFLGALDELTLPAASQPYAQATSPTSSMDAWGILDAAPAYDVNSLDDAVLAMHPDATSAWPHVVPNTDRGLTCTTISTPREAWHQKELGAWEGVYRQIDTMVQQTLAQKPKRVHLVVKGPYSLGALLGARLDPQNCDLLVYQHDNKDGDKQMKIWRPWGPAWPVTPGSRKEPFFEAPPEIAKRRPDEDGDIAIIVNISGRGEVQPCVDAIQLRSSHRPVRPVVIQAKKTGQGAIATPADADKASTELAQYLQQAAEMLSKATLHLFYYGPLAVLIRASRGLRMRPPVIVYEAICPDGAWRWVPAIAFPEGKLLLGTPAP